MADQQSQAAGAAQTPVPGPAQMAPATPADLRARAAALRREAAQIEASLAGTGTVMAKVGPPHSEMQFGGFVIGVDFTPVPAGRLADLRQAADRAGIQLITEG